MKNSSPASIKVSTSQTTKKGNSNKGLSEEDLAEIRRMCGHWSIDRPISGSIVTLNYKGKGRRRRRRTK